jgi:membrane protease YdiL (CAAX protease family)
MLLLRALGLIFLFVVVQVIASLVLAPFGSVDIHAPLTVAATLKLAASQALGVLAVVWIVAVGSANTRILGLREDRRHVWAGLLALTPAGLLVVGPTIAAVVADGERLLNRHVDLPTACAYVLLAVLIGCNEELWFRGLIVHTLGGRAHPWLVVLGSAVLFGLPHIGGDAASLLNAFAVTLAIGVPFAVVRLRHRSLLPLIFWHAVVDAWAFLHTASITPGGNPSAAEVAAGLILPSIVALGYLIVFERARSRGALAPD